MGPCWLGGRGQGKTGPSPEHPSLQDMSGDISFLSLPSEGD